MNAKKTTTGKQVHTSMSTGIPGLDRVFQGVHPGDNIVFQVESIDEYVPFVQPFCIEAIREGRDLIYFRFAEHQELIPEGVEARTYILHPEEGFEHFISEIFSVIEHFGTGACYVFDCLSELAADWYSDRMLGNFFMLTCPYLYDFETATYFALLRNRHMTMATSTIRNTAQVVVDVYRNRDTLYVHPLKVWKRYSTTMYTVHRWEGGDFTPVTTSATISEILGSVPQPWLDFSIQHLDLWTRTFAQAQQSVEELRRGAEAGSTEKALFDQLLRMAITRDQRLLDLAAKYFELADLVEVGKRMIGTGLIGGKSVGMLVARAIMCRKTHRWRELLEAHDSFFIGSDVFYTYLIQNGCWWMRRKLKLSGGMLDGAEEVRQRMLKGTFPAEIQQQFTEMLNYFGQSPIIVRSSSLLEDAYGNAFSGKYESVFCANQGTPQERLESFMDAVRTVYASTMRREALAYRAHWGLLDRDEQMAILVQRVSGEMHGDMFFPQVAGVGFSFNPFVWSKEIDPEAGMLRLVFGLGTRAVDRHDDDYTRVVALNAPTKRPEADFDEVRKYAQRHVDLLDLEANQHVSREFEEVATRAERLPLDVYASRDEEMERRAREHNMSNVFSHVLTFEHLLAKTDFVGDMREMLATLQQAYNYPVDVEFTTNVVGQGRYRINLVQCRPFQVKGETRIVESPGEIDEADIVLKSSGPIVGNSVATQIDRLIYVVPESYSKLSMNARYSVARLIGRLTHLEHSDTSKPVIALLGPGRWGTTTPSLGVPVSFTEINTVSILCELAAMHEGLVPDISLGTHFFNDLVEMDMLYLAVYPDRDGYIHNRQLLAATSNRLTDLLPDAASWAETVRVIEGTKAGNRGSIVLNVNALEQEGVCYLSGNDTDR